MPTRARYGVVLLLFVTVVLNYLDRGSLSLVAPLLSKELGIDSIRMGLIFSAFAWSYAACQIPGGWLSDRVHPRVLYGAAIALWSVATALLALPSGLVALFALRAAVGLFEAPSFPINNRVVTTWFPERERATAIAFYTSGQFVGLGLLAPVLMAFQVQFGWRTLFVFLGAAGIVWAAVWWLIYRDPESSKFANSAEVAWIRAGGGLPRLGERSTGDAVSIRDLGRALGHSKLWGLYIGQFSITTTQWFFLTWFPTYLVQYRKMSLNRAGILGALPFLAAFGGILCSGVFSDYLVRRGVSLGVARKAPVIAGLVLSTAIIGANFVRSPAWVIGFMTVAFFGNGFASITWSLVSAVAPVRVLGLTGGVFNLMGNLPGIVTPTVIGALVSGGDFSPALVYVGAMALLGAISYLVVVGCIERLPG
jgi:ACS family D-galactonate transporter-like MFS transporter